MITTTTPATREDIPYPTVNQKETQIQELERRLKFIIQKEESLIIQKEALLRLPETASTKRQWEEFRINCRRDDNTLVAQYSHILREEIHCGSEGGTWIDQRHDQRTARGDVSSRYTASDGTRHQQTDDRIVIDRIDEFLGSCFVVYADVQFDCDFSTIYENVG